MSPKASLTAHFCCQRTGHGKGNVHCRPRSAHTLAPRVPFPPPSLEARRFRANDDVPALRSPVVASLPPAGCPR